MLWRVGKTLWLRAQPCMSDAWYVRLLTVASNQFNSWTQSVKWSSRTRTLQWQRIYFKKFGRLHELFSKIRPSYCEAKILRQGPALQLPPDTPRPPQSSRDHSYRIGCCHVPNGSLESELFDLVPLESLDVGSMTHSERGKTPQHTMLHRPRRRTQCWESSEAWLLHAVWSVLKVIENSFQLRG